jgi:lipopolysaccharide export system protein LptA
MRALAALALLLATAVAAGAQEQASPMQGFAINRNQPLTIESNMFRARDDEPGAFADGTGCR